MVVENKWIFFAKYNWNYKRSLAMKNGNLQKIFGYCRGNACCDRYKSTKKGFNALKDFQRL